MLKEVGASGQISLGKKYAGQLFDVVFAPDGRVELVPMKAVPTVRESTTGTVTVAGSATGSALGFNYPESAPPSNHAVQEAAAAYRVGDGWLTPERITNSPKQSESIEQWAKEHEVEIDQYNAWASQREPYAQRVRRWRESAASQVMQAVQAVPAVEPQNTDKQ